MTKLERIIIAVACPIFAVVAMAGCASAPAYPPIPPASEGPPLPPTLTLDARQTMQPVFIDAEAIRSASATPQMIRCHLAWNIPLPTNICDLPHVTGIDGSNDLKKWVNEFELPVVQLDHTSNAPTQVFYYYQTNRNFNSLFDSTNRFFKAYTR